MKVKMPQASCSGPCARKMSLGRLWACRACHSMVCRPCVLHHACSTGRAIMYVKAGEIFKKVLKELNK